MGGLAYNTIASLGRQGGEIVGIKGGDGWMREKFGVSSVGSAFGQFGGTWRKGGFIGVGRQAKHFFGFGFESAARQGLGMGAAVNPYLQSLGGGKALRTLGYEGMTRKALRGGEAAMERATFELGGLAGRGQDIFRRRRIAGGVGLAAGAVLAGNTIGFGNLATMGIGAGAGAVLGGAIGRGVMGSAATAARKGAGGAMGRKIGGRLGLGIAGLGLITGVL